MKNINHLYLLAILSFFTVFLTASTSEKNQVQANSSKQLIYTEKAMTMYKSPGKGKLKGKLPASVYRNYAKSGKWTKVKNKSKKYVWIKGGKNVTTSYKSKYKNTETEIIRLINVERSKVGVKKLKVSKSMKRYTILRSQDMSKNKYFGHSSPVYGRWANLLYSSEYQFSYAGENLAAGFTKADDFVNAWMASPSHRKNMLNPKFKKTSITVIEGKSTNRYQTYATQWFEK